MTSTKNSVMVPSMESFVGPVKANASRKNFLLLHDYYNLHLMHRSNNNWRWEDSAIGKIVDGTENILCARLDTDRNSGISEKSLFLSHGTSDDCDDVKTGMATLARQFNKGVTAFTLPGKRLAGLLGVITEAIFSLRSSLSQMQGYNDEYFKWDCLCDSLKVDERALDYSTLWVLTEGKWDTTVTDREELLKHFSNVLPCAPRLEFFTGEFAVSALWQGQQWILESTVFDKDIKTHKPASSGNWVMLRNPDFYFLTHQASGCPGSIAFSSERPSDKELRFLSRKSKHHSTTTIKADDIHQVRAIFQHDLQSMYNLLDQENDGSFSRELANIRRVLSVFEDPVDRTLEVAYIWE